MAEHVSPFTLEQIGTKPVRFSSSGIFATHKDQMVDPYTATRIPKEAQVEGTQYLPQGKGPFPSIILLHDRWGLTSQIQTIAKQLACEGYIVLAPNLYGRQGGMITANDEVAEALMARLNHEQALEDLNACCEFLNTNITEDILLDNTKRNMHAVIGLGMGGNIAIQLAARRRRMRAAVSFYGSLPDNIQDITKQLYCPLLYHAVNQNGSSSLDDVKQFQAQAQEGGKKIDIQSYPDATAGFCNQAHPHTYHEETAQEAWRVTIAFIDGILKAA